MAEENKRVIGGRILRESPPPPCFCVSRGNKGITVEFLGSRGNKGLTRAVASGGCLVASKRRVEEGVVRVVRVPDEFAGRVEMAREQRPLNMTGGA